MTRKEIASNRGALCRILTEVKDENERLEALKELAEEVGAGSMRKGKVLIRQVAGKQKYQEADLITEAEIVLNINNALQTETMIDMCKTATRNFWIAIAAAIIAALIALAAWAAIMVNLLIAVLTSRIERFEL